MKYISVKEAIGLRLCHDITQIIPGVSKSVAFSKGHIVSAADIDVLLKLGKEHLYVWEEDNLVHEDDAAKRISKAIAGKGIAFSKPVEGRINLIAQDHGLLKINLELLNRINSIPDVTVATAHNLSEVAKSKLVAGTRVIPLVVTEATVQAVEDCCLDNNPVLQIIAFKSFKVGVIATGSEVFYGRITDAFTPILEKKFQAWGSKIHYAEIVPDQTKLTVAAIYRALEAGADLITVTGGMSVDPDDKTPAAIRAVADEVISYGAPVFPGAMFMVAYKGNIPIFGLPGCVMYNRASVFDLILPRVLAGMRITKHDITSLAHGGLCEACAECHYPNCAFGK